MELGDDREGRGMGTAASEREGGRSRQGATVWENSDPCLGQGSCWR